MDESITSQYLIPTVPRNGPYQITTVIIVFILLVITISSTVLCKTLIIVHNVQIHVEYALIAYIDNK